MVLQPPKSHPKRCSRLKLSCAWAAVVLALLLRAQGCDGQLKAMKPALQSQGSHGPHEAADKPSVSNASEFKKLDYGIFGKLFSIMASTGGADSTLELKLSHAVSAHQSENPKHFRTQSLQLPSPSDDHRSLPSPGRVPAAVTTAASRKELQMLTIASDLPARSLLQSRPATDPATAAGLPGVPSSQEAHPYIFVMKVCWTCLCLPAA